MSNHKQHIFGKVDNLSLKKKISILDLAKELSYEYRIDKLDCSISWSRQQIDMSFEDVMKKFDSSCHFVVILRRGFDFEKNKGEIGFRSGGKINYFLFIYLTPENLEKIIKKYNLKKR